MIIVMRPDATEENLAAVAAKLEALGLRLHISKGEARTILGVIGDRSVLRDQAIDRLPGVEKAIPVMQPFKLVNREFHPEDTVVEYEGVRIGGERLAIMAGPCSVENRDMLLETAAAVKKAGATVLRGGAFKPRTSPYSFQGLGEEGLKYLAEARERTGLLVVTELMDPRDMPVLARYADIIQIGARNMHNFRLLTEVGDQPKPVLLKRGMSATIEELLMSAEYIMSRGNSSVILCERGIRTFETYTRNTLDLSAIPVVKRHSHLPIIVDPSHGLGYWEYVETMSKAAIVAGADGLILEVHPRPEEALSDGAQSLKPERFEALMRDLAGVAALVHRKV